MKVYWSPRFNSARHRFDTLDKSAAVAAAIKTLPGIEIVAPEPATERDLRLVHAPRYVDAVRTGRPADLASSNGFPWDPGIWTSTTASTGGMVAAALEARTTGAVSGSLSSGLHHAGVARGGGFCTFNGLALAAVVAADTFAIRVLIVDFDAHYGDGTAAIIRDFRDVSMIDVSTNPMLPEDPYLERCRAALDSVRGSDFDLVIYNAGVDPHQNCHIGGEPGVNDVKLMERDEMVFGFCRAARVPVAFALAGGYAGPRISASRIVRLHVNTIEVALDSCRRLKAGEPARP